MTQTNSVSPAWHSVAYDRAASAAAPQLEPPTAVVRLLRRVSAIWIGYIFILAVIDHYFAGVSANVHPLPILYYVTQLLIAIAVFALSCSRYLQLRLGRAFLPITIVCMSALPLITTSITVPYSWLAPITGASGLVGLRALPILTVVVVLIAWQYHWKHVVRFSLGTNILSSVLLFVQLTGFLHALVITAMQTLSLLIIGYCACALMDKLRAQGAALEQANTQLRHYAATLEQFAVSRERNRVARELHDTLAHTLSGLTVQLETTKAYLDVNPQAVHGMVETALETTRNGLRETRRALKALRASPLEDLGLRLALCTMAEQAVADGHLRLDCAIAENLPFLAPDVEQCIYRIAQEAVVNAVHYAAADTLTLQLSYTDGQVVLTVQDNGRGFDERERRQPGHFGISGMYERAALAGGTLAIESVSGAGTTVSFRRL